MAFMRIVVESQSLEKKLNQVSKDVDDFRPAFKLISKDWFKGNKAFFRLKSPGRFKDLSELYKNQKRRKLGFVYPILRGDSRKLERSITEPSSGDSVNDVGKKVLEMGTKVPYAIYIHAGTVKMVPRPFVLIGAGSTGPTEFNKREKAWLSIIDDWVEQLLRK